MSIMCRVDALGLEEPATYLSATEVLCSVPSLNYVGTFPVDISLNDGNDFTGYGADFQFFSKAVFIELEQTDDEITDVAPEVLVCDSTVTVSPVNIYATDEGGFRIQYGNEVFGRTIYVCEENSEQTGCKMDPSTGEYVYDFLSGTLSVTPADCSVGNLCWVASTRRESPVRRFRMRPR